MSCDDKKGAQAGFDEEMLAERMAPQDGQPARIAELVGKIREKIKSLPANQAVVEAMAVDAVIGYQLISESFGQKLADEALIKKIHEVGISMPPETVKGIISETRRLSQLFFR
mgnify:CR=1 FL=1